MGSGCSIQHGDGGRCSDALGYDGAAWLIERERLTAFQVSRMFLSGASKDRGIVAAVVVLAGAAARHQ